MRVLVTVNDAYGHVLPFIATVREFRRRGHEVLVASPGSTADRLDSGGVRFARHPVTDTPPPLPAPPRGDRSGRLAWAVRTSWPHVARAWAPALLADAAAFRPDVVVCEPVEHAGRVAAAALEVPVVEHGWGFTLPAGSSAAATDGLADLYRTLDARPREPALRVDFGPATVQSPDREPDVHRYRFVPWAPPGDALPPPGAKPRVLLTLGTFAHPGAADRLRAVAATAGLDIELAVVLGHDDRGTTAGFPAGALITPWVDLPFELSRCTLVIHHGGAGTSWAALATGLPAVCLPQAGDQFRNAALLAGAGAAIVVEPETVERAPLRDAIAAALADPALAAAAARIRLANDDLPGVTALVDRVETVA